MQVHGLEYAGMASVRLNESPWVALNNQSVAVAEPGRSYGGIGGGFATLTLTLALRPGGMADGNNPICFRFNGTNGVSSGFRVLAFNLLASDGRALLPAEAFEEEDPNLWTPPLADPANIAAGRALWNSAPLVASGLSNAPPIRAHCSDCHARDGRDLRYFNYSNASIEARSRFHGLSAQEGKQIASYIRALPLPNPGRPWNPPYQPGPGQRTVKAANWAAGAGLKWVLDRDSETLRYLFPASATGLAITPAAFAPDANLDPREIPIAFELPDWNHWLPRVHPKDAFGAHFDNSDQDRRSIRPLAEVACRLAGSAPGQGLKEMDAGTF
jgi:cytochrome c553